MPTNNKIRRWGLLGLAILIILPACSCNCGTEPETVTVEPIDLEFVDPPIDLRGIEASFAQDIPYGPYERNVFDIFLAASEEPTPLVIFIHGGGFTSGGKAVPYLNFRNEIRDVLAAGVSYATINYRLLEENDDEGIIKSMSDGRRCLQFLRYHHEQLNIDPERIALSGVSAGAGTCTWLAFTDDMADPDADDPVLRESTRVSVLGLKAAGATYDLYRWETDVFVSLGLTFEEMAEMFGSAESEEGLLSFYGAETLEDLITDEFKAYRASVDLLALMSPDDPPFWVQNNVENPGIPVDKGELFHHGLHAVTLMDRAAEVGVECQCYVPALDVADPAGQEVVEFMLERLGVE